MAIVAVAAVAMAVIRAYPPLTLLMIYLVWVSVVFCAAFGARRVGR
jgi:hypothetical protein